MLLLKPADEAATEEIFVLRIDCASLSHFDTVKPSRDSCVVDERALWPTPLAIQSVYKCESCAGPHRQNMQMVPEFRTPYDYVNVDTKEDDVCATYKNRVRAGVGGIKEIGVSLAWPDKNQFMHVANGNISCVDIFQMR